MQAAGLSPKLLRMTTKPYVQRTLPHWAPSIILTDLFLPLSYFFLSYLSFTIPLGCIGQFSSLSSPRAIQRVGRGLQGTQFAAGRPASGAHPK